MSLYGEPVRVSFVSGPDDNHQNNDTTQYITDDPEPDDLVKQVEFLKSRTLELEREIEIQRIRLNESGSRRETENVDSESYIPSSMLISSGGKIGSDNVVVPSNVPFKKMKDERRVVPEIVKNVEEYFRNDEELNEYVKIFEYTFCLANDEDLRVAGKDPKKNEKIGLHENLGYIKLEGLDAFFIRKSFGVKIPLDLKTRRELLFSMMLSNENVLPDLPYLEYPPSYYIVSCFGIDIMPHENSDHACVSLIMEECDYSVRSLLQTRTKNEGGNPLSLKERFDIMKKMSMGLYVLHNARLKNPKSTGILHNDIKPSNFLVKNINNNRRIKLCDFGGSERADKIMNDRDNYAIGIEFTKGWVYDEEEKFPSFKRDICSLGFCFACVYFSIDKLCLPKFTATIDDNDDDDDSSFSEQFQTIQYPKDFEILLRKMWKRKDPENRCDIHFVIEWFKKHSEKEWMNDSINPPKKKVKINAY